MVLVLNASRTSQSPTQCRVRGIGRAGAARVRRFAASCPQPASPSRLSSASRQRQCPCEMGDCPRLAEVCVRLAFYWLSRSWPISATPALLRGSNTTSPAFGRAVKRRDGPRPCPQASRRSQNGRTASAALAMSGFARAGCTATPPKSGSETSENAGERQPINADVELTLTRLYTTASGSGELVANPRSMLVFRQSSRPVSGSAASTAKARCA